MIDVLLAAMAVVAPVPEPPPWDYQDRYCAGMEQERPVPFGGRVDCIDQIWVFETEYAEDWYSAVGQILYYSQVTRRRPGIIILCRSPEPEVEFECRSDLYRLEQALKRIRVPVMVWECFPEDMTLQECDRPFGVR